MLSPSQLRRYVFPWHKAIIDLAHSCGRPVILHSCGNYTMILDDLFSLGYDGRHSYEDNIIPVEKAYEQFQGKIAVMGGIDMDFLVRSSPEQIRERCEAILQKTGCRGYALGSGNSIPEYVPFENYLAMIETAKRSL